MEHRTCNCCAAVSVAKRGTVMLVSEQAPENTQRQAATLTEFWRGFFPLYHLNIVSLFPYDKIVDLILTMLLSVN